MSSLARTDLTTSMKIDLAAAAFAMQGQHGAVARLSRDFGVCRATVSRAAVHCSEALSRQFDSEERAALVAVDRSQLERAVVALRMMGRCSVRGIVDLLPELYAGVTMGYGTVQSVLARAEVNAAAFNCTLDLTASKNIALDELFSQGEPVLAAVCLDTGLALCLDRLEGRSSADWQAALSGPVARGLSVEVAVRDGAAGIADAVAELWPQAEQRDDCFHALHVMMRCRTQLERRAYGLMRDIEGYERDIGKARAKLQPNRCRIDSLLERARTARAALEKAMALHDRFEALLWRIHEAMELLDVDAGVLRTVEQMQAELRAAAGEMAAMAGKAGKAGRYVLRRVEGLTSYVAPTTERLDALSDDLGERQVHLAMLVLRLAQMRKQRRHRGQDHDLQQHLAAAFAALVCSSGDVERAEAVLQQVLTILRSRHRASSAIEGFNAALRPYLTLHKRVTTGFLALFQAWYNLRLRRWGRFAGTSAIELAIGRRTGDWLTILGFPRSVAAA